MAVSTSLPDNVTQALATDAVGGYKPFDEVVESLVAVTGCDLPVARATIIEYVRNGHITIHGKNTDRYLRPAKGQFLPRLTEEQYSVLEIVLEFVAKVNFELLPFTDIKGRLTNPRSLYAWLGLFVDLGILLKEGGTKGRYRLGSISELSVFPPNSFVGGRIVRVGPLSITESFPEGNFYGIEELRNTLTQQLAIYNNASELRTTLVGVNTPSAEIDRLVDPIMEKCRLILNGDRAREDINILSMALEVIARNTSKE